MERCDDVIFNITFLTKAHVNKCKSMHIVLTVGILGEGK